MRISRKESEAPARRRVGACSWSFRAGSVAELVDGLSRAGVAWVQLALDPVRTGALPSGELEEALAGAGIGIASGMMTMEGEDYGTLESIRRTGGVVPDETWPANLEAARADAPLAAELGIRLVTFHAGFVPHEPADPRRPVLVERLRTLADVYGAHGVRVALETGQETADTLLELLDEVGDAGAGVGANFDPANMILYGMGDPVDALRRLAPRIFQVHIKDALPSPVPGEWGTEVPAGTGAVDWPAFFRVLREAVPAVDLMIEREAGDDRAADIRRARELVEAELAGGGAEHGR